MSLFRNAALALVLSSFSLWSYGCASGEESVLANATSKAESLAVNVKVETVTPNSMTESIRLLGQTDADKDVTYSAEVAGRLEYLSVDLGDTVTKGQIIARVDYEMLKAQADQAAAAFDLAEKTFNRLETLNKDELVTQQQIDEASSQKIQAQAQLQQAQAALNRSVVRATVDGIITAKYVEEGEYMMPGSPIIRVLDYSTIQVNAQVPETRVSEISKDVEVKIIIDALGKTFPAELDVLVPESDPESRTFTIRVKADNPLGEILAGMAATLIIETRKHENVIVIPQEVVLEQSDGRYVFVADNGIARKHKVTLGATEKYSVIIESGLELGEEIIVQGHRQLVDGQPINIIP